MLPTTSIATLCLLLIFIARVFCKEGLNTLSFGFDEISNSSITDKSASISLENQSNLAREKVNNQILSMFENDENYIYVYAAVANRDIERQKWQFFYMPVMRPVKPLDSD